MATSGNKWFKPPLPQDQTTGGLVDGWIDAAIELSIAVGLVLFVIGTPFLFVAGATYLSSLVGPTQLRPPDLGWGWLFLGGRSAGKSHSMSAAVHMAVRAGITRIHLIAPTTADFHDINLGGRSGILATCGRDPRPRWVSSKRRLEWPNSAMCVFPLGRGAGKPARSAMRACRDR